ncbi:hypothetical protein L7F22_038708 [Adiantum nelumboides]|nr:hypothetical protein [Adiantum nelumboides]
MGTRLDFSSFYHPETDGQSEIANLTILDMLKCYVSDQKTEWENYLPLVEFAYNNTTHSSTGKAPFEIIYGKPLLPPILCTKEKIFATDEFVRDIDTVFQQVKQAISRTQDKQKNAADKHRRQLILSKDQWVLLRFHRTRFKTIARKVGKALKLSPCYYGPFQITESINNVTFRLALPPTWKIHNAFHSSLLKPYVGVPPSEPISEEPPTLDELDEVLEPEQIISHRDRVLRNGKRSRRFLVKFKNYSPLDAKWMDTHELHAFSHLVQPYLEAFQLRATEY